MSRLILFNGYPGCGKLTIARLLNTKLGARLLDNHTLMNPARALFDRNESSFWKLRKEIAELVFRELVASNYARTLIVTDSLGADDGDAQKFSRYVELAASLSFSLSVVQLECELEENVRRLTMPERAERYKLTDGQFFRKLRQSIGLLRPEGVHCIELDVTNLMPEEAAQRIAENFSQNES